MLESLEHARGQRIFAAQLLVSAKKSEARGWHRAARVARELALRNLDLSMRSRMWAILAGRSLREVR